MSARPEKTAEKRNPAGQFAAGNAGKPKGARHKATRAVLELLDGEADALTRKAIDMALAGDTVAMRLCLERLASPVKDRPISVALPALAGANDAPKAMAVIVAAMSAGEVTPAEAAAIAGVVETYRRTVETAEIERRLAVLEAQK